MARLEAILQSKKQVPRKIAAGTDALIRSVDVLICSLGLDHPNDRFTASFHLVNLMSRSSSDSLLEKV